MNFFNVLKMEFLKLKRSYVWLFMIAAPLLMVIFGAYNFVRYQDVFLKGNAVPWEKLLGQIVTFYGLLLLPLSIAVMAVWLSRIEHSENNWKYLFTLPMDLKLIYAAKSIIHILLVGLSMLILYLGTIIAATIVNVGVIPYQSLAVSTLICWVTCLPILALQMILSIRFPNIGIPVGISLAASIASVVITNTSYGQYYFWSLPSITLLPSSEGTGNVSALYLLSVSLVAFVCLLAIGYQLFRRQEA
ncbi:ABC transporter permease [Metabacillus arenae]|uniref:ABC transporter permease n=1 Tax=Metabacillus arenae TaxID=2771434 RepID=A0A926NM91_9BACI|nr:ABC transporter permease [Metabacillus arenae]MBD1383218.1 ABC transporter permease [Metabacillus arenae]